MQQKTESQSCAITDANILINFIKIGRVDILQQLRMYVFYLSEEVYREITYPAQRLVLDHALKNGWLRETVITDQNELRSHAQYRRQMGDGEAACLAIAICRKWIMACDEQKKKLISRTVQHHLGAGYLLNTPGILLKAIREPGHCLRLDALAHSNTPGILLKAIREGILTISQADAIKNTLAQNRFVMPFASFQNFI